jgi:hypothetical protein
MDERLRSVADGADIVVGGYAFTRTPEGNVRVLNLNIPTHAAVLAGDGAVLETNMDDIELAVVGDYFAANRQFIEE